MLLRESPRYKQCFCENRQDLAENRRDLGRTCEEQRKQTGEYKPSRIGNCISNKLLNKNDVE